MPINSLSDLFLRLSRNDAGLGCFRTVYELSSEPAVRMTMNDLGWAVTRQTMATDDREEVEFQTIFIVRDRLSGHEVAINQLRTKRGGRPQGEDPALLIDRQRDENPCPWCDPQGYWQPDLWADEFGQISTLDSSNNRKFVAQSNWARLAPISGIALGDREAHNHLRLSRDQFIGMIEVAERYIERAREARPNANSFIVFMNGGPKAAASVSHAHLQIVGKEGDHHFGHPQTLVSRCGGDYWERVRAVHEELGLLVTRGDSAVAWVNVAPVRDRDITVASTTISGGAELVYDLLRILIEKGTNNFTLAAILSKEYVTKKTNNQGWKWPPVLWRLIDRGDMRVRHSDVGAMEFFGSCVVSTDPFEVASWIKNV